MGWTGFCWGLGEGVEEGVTLEDGGMVAVVERMLCLVICRVYWRLE
jgi:hypothetical protein